MRELRNALVIGGAGFLGGAVIRELLELGAEVTSLDRDPRGRVDRRAQSVQADVAAGERTLHDLLRSSQFDAVFHMVGTGSVPRSLEHPLGDLTANAGAVLALLEQLRDLPRPPLLVYLSSAAVYGESIGGPMGEDHPLRPVSPYGISKYAGEQYVRLYRRLYGLPSVTARPFSVYGPGQRKLVVYDLLRRLEAGESPLEIRAPAEVARDLVYGPDAARAVTRLAQHAHGDGEVYNLSSGRAVTLRELAATLIEIGGFDAQVRFTGDLRPGDPLRWEGDPTRAAALGVECATSLRTGLAATIRWFREDRGLPMQSGVDLLRPLERSAPKPRSWPTPVVTVESPVPEVGTPQGLTPKQASR
jgi:UDP-glucose 4-epimerase